MQNPRRLFAILTISLSIFFSCQPHGKDPGKKKILVTTGFIGDAANNILKGIASVEVLMGPGVDPHLYKASQGDMQKLSEADVIIFNGLHLEGKMTDIFEKLEKRKPVIAVSEGISSNKLLKNDLKGSGYDPHIWLDAGLWSSSISYLGNELKDLFPEDSAEIIKNTKDYVQSLQELDAYAKSTLAEIPASGRILITSHDAFRYFGRAYDINVRGLQGISTISEYGLRDVNEMVNYITTNKIKAVFIESSVSEKSIQAVMEGCIARNHRCVKGGMLFSDALGKANTAEGTYKGMFRYNLQTIVNALK